jgi:hypothetical protein
MVLKFNSNEANYVPINMKKDRKITIELVKKINLILRQQVIPLYICRDQLCPKKI